MMRKGRSWTELMWKGVQGSYALLQIVSFSAAARQRSRSTLHLSNLKTNKSTLFNEGDTQQSSTDISPWPPNSRSNWNLEMLVFKEGGKPENPEKNPRSKGENQQQTQPTYDARSGNRTRDTLGSLSNDDGDPENDASE